MGKIPRGALTVPLSSWMPGVRDAANRALISARVGSEACNTDTLTHIADYVREFVTAADQLELGNIQIIPFVEAGAGVGPQPYRTIQRDGKDRVLIYIMSAAAFDKCENDVQIVAGNTPGIRWLELSFIATVEKEARALLTRVSERQRAVSARVDELLSHSVDGRGMQQNRVPMDHSFRRAQVHDTPV
jgi:hypothetical protein